MTQISEGSPFYTSSILRSRFKHKNLTTVKGLIDTLEFETLDNRLCNLTQTLYSKCIYLILFVLFPAIGKKRQEIQYK